MRTVVLSLWVWFAIAALIVLWLPVMLVARLLDRDPAHYHAGLMLRRVGRTMTYVNPFWDIDLEGPFPDNPRAPYVAVSNHFSQADPPIIARVPWDMKWVAKAELFRIPIAGWLLRLSGDISVDRSDKHSRAQVLDTAASPSRRTCRSSPSPSTARTGPSPRTRSGSTRTWKTFA